MGKSNDDNLENALEVAFAQSMTLSEMLANVPPQDFEPRQIAHLLRVTVECLEAGELDRAAWRLADAGALLRYFLETTGWDNVLGLDIYTGRGAVLPKRRIP